MKNCIFCKIINKEIPSYKIYEDEKIYAFLDINPKSNGHTLIIPKKHYTDITELPNEDLIYMKKISLEITSTLQKKLNSKGFTYLYNYGDTQEVKHFHLHVIPNYSEGNTISDIKEIYNILGGNK